MQGVSASVDFSTAFGTLGPGVAQGRYKVELLAYESQAAPRQNCSGRETIRGRGIQGGVDSNASVARPPCFRQAAFGQVFFLIGGVNLEFAGRNCTS